MIRQQRPSLTCRCFHYLCCIQKKPEYDSVVKDWSTRCVWSIQIGGESTSISCTLLLSVSQYTYNILNTQIVFLPMLPAVYLSKHLGRNQQLKCMETYTRFLSLYKFVLYTLRDYSNYNLWCLQISCLQLLSLWIVVLLIFLFFYFQMQHRIENINLHWIFDILNWSRHSSEVELNMVPFTENRG